MILFLMIHSVFRVTRFELKFIVAGQKTRKEM